MSVFNLTPLPDVPPEPDRPGGVPVDWFGNVSSDWKQYQQDMQNYGDTMALRSMAEQRNINVNAVNGIDPDSASWWNDDLWRQEYFNKEQQKYNSLEAQKARDYEREMRDTAYTQLADQMRSLGLNPALMFTSGSFGASVPNGASASTSGSFVSSGEDRKSREGISSKDRSSRLLGILLGSLISSLGQTAGRVVSASLGAD